MTLKHSRVLTLTVLSAMAASSAQAGGLEANGYNWDLIFDPATYAAKGTVTHVNIDHEVTNPNPLPPFGIAVPGTVAASADRIHYNLAVKADLTDAASCMISAQNPWGSGTDRDITYAALTGQAASERVTSFDAGLTCSYGFEMGGGIFSVLGGISAQTLGYDADIPITLTDTSPLELAGSGVGLRTGIAYEMEEIALRVSAIYNAPIDYDLDGSFFGAPASASVTTPQSLELKAQTGIAPGWLALASVKWVDWSVLETLDVTSVSPTPISTTLNYRDGWTVTGGVGHALTEDFTVLGTVTWDRGTSKVNDDGVLENGTLTDRWGVTLGGAYTFAESMELSGGISYSTLADGTNMLGETWDRGSVLAISASLKASF